LLGRSGSLYRLQPLAGTPTSGAIMFDSPPGESIGALRPFDHDEDVPVVERLDGWFAGAWARTKAKPCTFGVDHSDGSTDGEAPCGSRGYSSRFGRREQRRIEPAGDEVFTSQRAELYGRAGRRIHLPLDARLPEVLGDDPGLHGQFADGRTQHLQAARLLVEGQETETDVMPSLGEVAAEPVSDHGVRHRRDPGSLATEEFAQRAQAGLTRGINGATAFPSGALEVLHESTVLFERFRDGRAEDLHASLGLEGGQERLVDEVSGLREVCGRFLLGLAGAECEQDQTQCQAPDNGKDDLVQHEDLGQRDLQLAIIAHNSHETQTDRAMRTRGVVLVSLAL
jgi:hypothetical protein